MVNPSKAALIVLTTLLAAVGAVLIVIGLTQPTTATARGLSIEVQTTTTQGELVWAGAGLIGTALFGLIALLAASMICNELRYETGAPEPKA